jgi:hypothetical protein
MVFLIYQFNAFLSIELINKAEYDNDTNCIFIVPIVKLQFDSEI